MFQSLYSHIILVIQGPLRKSGLNENIATRTDLKNTLYKKRLDVIKKYKFHFSEITAVNYLVHFDVYVCVNLHKYKYGGGAL